jgi:hypothetical protein
MGRRVAEEKKLVGTYPPFRPYPKRITRTFKDASTRKGYAAAFYICGLWNLAFSVGYLAQKLFHIYKIEA